MKYLKKFNEELYPDDHFDNIKTISFDEVEELEEGRKSEEFTDYEIDHIKSLLNERFVSNFEVTNNKMGISFSSLIPGSKKDYMMIYIYKYSDEWFIASIGDMELRTSGYEESEFGNVVYHLCDSIPGLESYIAYVNKELEFEIEKGR
jgi:hypothetical protein